MDAGDTLYWAIAVISALCLIATLLPILDVPIGAVRIFEFPRIQIVTLASLTLAAAIWLIPARLPDLLVHLSLVVSIGIQLAYVIRFTPLWPSISKNADSDTEGVRLRIVISNVKQSNRDYGRLTETIARESPDIALFMETDQQWVDALATVTREYRHKISCPRDNSFGMHLVSKLPLDRKSVRYLINDEVPSFDTVVHLPDGRQFRLIALHPEPPMIHAESALRDGEIALVGKLIRQETLPVIVAGDLNDVAWSHTTRRFLRVSRLCDPREGRGLFSTFDARYWFLRWPLDHVFHSHEFRIVEFQRLDFVGSDHFPVRFDVVLPADPDSDPPENAPADLDDLAEVDAVVRRGLEIDRRPIGHDWED